MKIIFKKSWRKTVNSPKWSYPQDHFFLWMWIETCSLIYKKKIIIKVYSVILSFCFKLKSHRLNFLRQQLLVQSLKAPVIVYDHQTWSIVQNHQRVEVNFAICVNLNGFGKVQKKNRFPHLIDMLQKFTICGKLCNDIQAS